MKAVTEQGLASRLGLERLDRLFFNISLAFFLAGILFGAILYPFCRENVENVMKAAYQGIMVEGDSLQSILNVFTRNLAATFIIMASGVLLGACFLIIAGNGLLVGLIASHVVEEGTHPLRVTLALLPHGVFEIPALLFASTLGARVGYSIINPGRETRFRAVISQARRSLKYYFTVIVPLLALAAVIEILVSAKMV